MSRDPIQMLILPRSEEPKSARVEESSRWDRVRHTLPIWSSPSRGRTHNARAALRPNFRTGAYYNTHGRLSVLPGHWLVDYAHIEGQLRRARTRPRSSHMELSLQAVTRHLDPVRRSASRWCAHGQRKQSPVWKESSRQSATRYPESVWSSASKTA